MRQQDIQMLRKRAFTYKRKHRLIELIQRKTNWNDYQISEVIKCRRQLILANSGKHRRNGDPASSHQQYIQTSLLSDGWTEDYLMSALSWSHDMKDDERETYDYYLDKYQYTPQMVFDINCMSRNPEWDDLSFRDEVAESDRTIRSGGIRTMVVKISDRSDNLLRPLKITPESRRRKSGMKLWQTIHSINEMARDIDYAHDLLTWLSNRELKRLGYTVAELDRLVLQPLKNP